MTEHNPQDNVTAPRELLLKIEESLELRCGTNAPERTEILPQLRELLEQPAVEPVWMPIEQKYPQYKEIDILMGDGSILCDVLPQSDGDLWWKGAGTGERFIDPKYANVTHWRVHCEAVPPQAQEKS